MNHPSRKELLSALGSKDKNVNIHLTECNWCSLYFELLSIFNFAGEIPLPSAPASWIEQAISVPNASSGKSGKIKSLLARVVFDSWAIPASVGVRGEALIQERRIRFDVSDYNFDLRAERRKNQWDFTARITDEFGQDFSCILVVGQKEIRPDEDGFYQWSSAKPPRNIKLLTGAGEFEIPELSWKISHSE